MEIIVPCETIFRLSKILNGAEGSWNTLRFDNSCVVATDGRFMAIENVARFEGIAHIVPDAAFIAQCETESKFNSRVTIVVNEMLKYTVAKTSLGYVTTQNLYYDGELGDKWDKWREVVMRAADPAKKPNGGMFWNLDGICKLIESSPSGSVVFEEVIDTLRPTLVRDTTDHSWLGVFSPMCKEQRYAPATMPSWMK